MEKELIELMEILIPKGTGTSEEVTRLFNIHNQFFPTNPQYAKHCVSCREKVFKKMIAKYEELKG